MWLWVACAHVCGWCARCCACLVGALNRCTPEIAPHTGQPPPVEAYGALVAGYARLRQAQPALGAVRRYHAAGGAPDKRMLETLADVSLRVGEYKVAMQVGGWGACARACVCVCGGGCGGQGGRWVRGGMLFLQ